MTIQDVINRRDIKYLVHFTRLENLDNILTNGIIPRKELDKQQVNYVYNDQLRLDEKTNYSCLSIGFPNDLMFYTKRKNNPNSEWVIIGVSLEVLLNCDCLFYPCNSASSNVSHKDISNFQGVKAFDEMFQNDLKHPQDIQAEVMVKGIIEPKYIKGCVFSEQKYVDEYSKKFPNLKFILHPNGQGFFGKREWTDIGY